MPVPQAHAHTRILKPFEDSEPTGLEVDIARIVNGHSVVPDKRVFQC